MIDLNDIALYVQVVRSGSFAEAARRLGTAPNSVSRRVQQLEAQLDTRLMQHPQAHPHRRRASLL
ncbi:helix-turn-helix domain-containing protein [Xanthomonas hortorum]|uniref:helix-turn-helix domain-containing protein n=1 Tax=Xanthomonas hortorum TaxID=56454 RepID=UPI000B026E0E|nr:LysR family transcriptional regulator [Xanthomonas hortorum]